STSAFCLLCSGYPRHLHSFPTRRSSDLMNGASAVALATGNDTRALEAGAHAYAARNGQYTSLTHWETDADGHLTGVLEMPVPMRSEEHTSELQSRFDIVCRLLLEKKKNM